MGVPPGELVDPRDDTFGVRLRRARELAGLTQDELAVRAGLSVNTLGGLERGEHRYPYPSTIRAIAEALGLTDEERKALAAAVPPRFRPNLARLLVVVDFHCCAVSLYHAACPPDACGRRNHDARIGRRCRRFSSCWDVQQGAHTHDWDASWVTLDMSQRERRRGSNDS